MPSAPLPGRPVSFRCMHAGVLVGPGRVRRGTPAPPVVSCELPDPWSGVGRTRDAADRPGCRAGDSPQAPWAREEPTEEAAPRTSEGSACGCRTPPLAWTLRCPSFTNPAARRGHQIPCIFCPCVNNKGGSGLGKRRKNTFKIIFSYLCHVL